MSLQNFVDSLDGLLTEAKQSLDEVASQEHLEELRVKFVGAKNGAIKAVQKLMGAIESEHRPAAGKRFNEVRDAIQSALESASERLGSSSQKVSNEQLVDPTLPGVRPILGQLHPITQTIEHLKDIMGRLGFSITEGPEIEDTWHNFMALNIPEDHPARSAGQFLFGDRQQAVAQSDRPRCDAVAKPNQHCANSGHGNAAVASSNHLARSSLSARCARCDALPNVSSNGRLVGRSKCNDGAAEKRFASLRNELSR